MPPPLGLNTKFFEHIEPKTFFLNFWGGGTPDPFFSRERTAPPHTPPHWRLRRLEPRVFGSAAPSQNPKYVSLPPVAALVDWLARLISGRAAE